MEIFHYAGNVAAQVGIMLLLILAGFLAAKCKWIGEDGVQQMINLLFYIVTPMVIIDSFLSVEYSSARLYSLLLMAGCAALVHLIGAVVSLLAYRREPQEKRAVLRCIVIFSNCGFMSLPLALALFGETGVFYVSIYVVVHNIIIWTAGIRLFDKGAVSVRKALINPGTVGVAIGLPLFLSGLALPKIMTQAVASLASLNTPLAMIVMGYYLSRTALRIIPGDGKRLCCMLLRLIVVPAIALAALWALPLPQEVFLACMLPACAPAASNGMMFASKFGGDVDSASRMVSVSTVLSIFTIPVFMTVARLLA